MPLKSEAIKTLLANLTHKDLAELYSLSMECQVNVAQDGGEKIDGEFKGRRWNGWTDGVTTWKPFRIPFKANTEPEYSDSEIKFDLAAHAEGIGMTGWDWLSRCSKWVAFDFDAITGHSDKHTTKLTPEQIEKVKQEASKIDWITIRRSTSGKGLHLYVFLNDVSTKNHNEHAALGRAILGKMSAITGFDFKSKVDICGGNMWVWHRKMQGTDGLTLIKKGTILTDVPPNWKDHVKVVSGARKKNLPQDIPETSFAELAGQNPKVALEEEHRKLISWLKDKNAFWWWDQDNHMLVTHTGWLSKAHEELGCKGFFKTNSDCTNLNEQNCFLFPLSRGAWTVRRYSPGVQEHESWTQDGQGWTKCSFNKEPDLNSVCRAFGGLENEKGAFIFREAEVAAKAIKYLGVNFNVDGPYGGRETTVKEHKDGRVIVQIERKNTDTGESFKGWIAEGNKPWTRIFQTAAPVSQEVEIGNYDDTVRHLTTNGGEDCGWTIKAASEWQDNPLTHVRVALASLGMGSKEITAILGNAVFRSWKIVNKPFQPEYPGDREWNRKAARLRFVPSTNTDDLRYPTWKKVLQHIGKNLDSTLKCNGWAQVNGITTGEDYLKCYIASLFQYPMEPLPYLFLYGPQNSGKTSLHEAISLLMDKGTMRADVALTSQSNFNSEIEGAILCTVEETDLAKNRVAYNRIKDWVTTKDILIHGKNETPYQMPNTTHWIQCANDHKACPIFPGDTRITMIFVESLDPLELIPKKQLIPLLEAEAPDFLAEILNLEIPESNDRLNIPVIVTQDKTLAEDLNRTTLERFIADNCVPTIGCKIKFGDFYDKFVQSLDPNESSAWTKIKVGREIPPNYPKGRSHKDGQFYIGNIAWANTESEAGEKLVIRDGFLEPQK